MRKVRFLLMVLFSVLLTLSLLFLFDGWQGYRLNRTMSRQELEFMKDTQTPREGTSPGEASMRMGVRYPGRFVAIGTVLGLLAAATLVVRLVL